MTDDPRSEDPGAVASDARPAAFDLIWWQTHSFTTPLVLFLILLVLVAVVVLYRPLFQRVTDAVPPAGLKGLDRSVFTLRPAQADSTLYYVDRSPGQDTTDIFMLVISPTQTTPLNLTNSPDYVELFPVLAPIDDRVAFFAISSSGGRSLRVLERDSSILDVTYRGGNSRLGDRCWVDLNLPPQWGPDGVWIAFLGRCGDEKNEAIELFVTRADGTEVRAVTDSGNRVTSVRWLDNETLIYGEKRADGSSAIYRVSIADPEPQPDLLRVVDISD